MKRLLIVVVAIAALGFTKNPEIDSCKLKGIPLKGRVMVVHSNADLRVMVVDANEDLRVDTSWSRPSKCGEWTFVNSNEDFRIMYVNSSADIRVMFVNSSAGLP